MAKKSSAKEPKEAPKKAKKPVAKAVKKVAAKPKAQKEDKQVAAPEKRSYFYAYGKRKTAIATVRLYNEGKGQVTVNKRSFEDYFPVMTDRQKILSPLNITESQKTFDVSVHVQGSGVHSQAEAVRHAIAKALLAYNVALRSTLKHAGYLTRDSRIKERKKYGLKRARRAPQWQKR